MDKLVPFSTPNGGGLFTVPQDSDNLRDQQAYF